MDQFSKDGRKLRPRKKVSTTNERVEFHHEGHGYGQGSDRREGGYRSESGQHGGYHKSYGSESGQRREGGYRSEGGQRREGGYRSEGAPRSYGAPKKSYGDKPQNGGFKKGGFRKPGPKKGGFTKESHEGIKRMIERTPRPAPKYSDEFNDMPIKDEIRLNKFIANSGVCSRREADTMIQAGVVTVNGEVVTELGTKVNVVHDVVKFNGETLRGEAKVYLVMNKPRGYVTTASDPHADKTVMDLLHGCSARVYPVGRLDKATTGVLMFTNDGEIAERLTHPSYDKKKIYQVILNKPLSEEDRQKILSGVELSDGPIAADALEFIDESDRRKLGIEIHSGKNRVVRRIFEAVGCEVRTLDRVYFAGLTKKGLKKGEWRYLTEGEANILKRGAYV
ncbi:MAG: rRNA pseudouridine synthase [Bacteroidales bacterium]|nr:rRNA pseudouridine synthase [Bacteroidales bacterium]